MIEYPKIDSIFKRDEKTHRFLIGEYSKPEFEYLRKNLWVWTEKVDGTNIRIEWSRDKNINIGGRTDNAQIYIPLMNKLQLLFNTEKLNSLYPDLSFTLFGEGYGSRIQKGGKNYSAEPDFVLFDILVGDFWLIRENVEEIANKLGVQVVPIIGDGNLDEMVEYIEYGFNSIWGEFIAEGIVARPKIEIRNRMNKRIITKVKYKDFKY